MATQTTNYNLTKPSRTDRIDIDVLNQNFDVIDSKLKEGLDMAEAAVISTPSRSVVNLTTTWSGSGPYTQTFTLGNVTITGSSKIDLQPDASTITQLITDGVKALYVENNNGTLTAYAIGACPTTTLSIQCTVSTTGTSVVSIAVTTQPTKTSYAVGNTLDLTGLAVTATYADSSTAVVTSQCKTSVANGTKLSLQGTQTISVSYLYNGITKYTSFTITVAPSLASIAVTTEPTTASYTVGDELDLTGIAVTATYSDNTTADVTSSCTFDPDDGDTLSTAGTQSIYITYEENGYQKSTATGVTVVASVLDYITVTTEPTTTTYTQGDTLDLTGLVVTATYESTYTADVTSNCVFSPENGDTLSTTGEVTVSIAYSENDVTKITTFTVTVNES